MVLYKLINIYIYMCSRVSTVPEEVLRTVKITTVFIAYDGRINAIIAHLFIRHAYSATPEIRGS